MKLTELDVNAVDHRELVESSLKELFSLSFSCMRMGTMVEDGAEAMNVVDQLSRFWEICDESPQKVRCKT